MTRLYEGMFLIDNDAVRAGWPQTKKRLSELLAKHGGSVEIARRWDERRLTYPIKKKNRATFLLAYFQLPGEAMPALVRDLEIGDLVLRHLIVNAEVVPDEERKAAAVEDSGDFVVPEPPADDVVDAEPAEAEGRDGAKGREDNSERDDSKRDKDSKDGNSSEGGEKSSDVKGSEPAMAGAEKEKQED